MYVITNREVVESARGLARFGSRPNARGPHELRLARVLRNGRRWNVDFLDDELDARETRALITKYGLALDPAEKHYASLKVACELASEARSRKSHILFFVHGYNNDMSDVLERAADLARRYKVLVVPFSWPARGGGAVSGTLSYKSDKRDARASTGALERALMIMHGYLRLINEAQRVKLFGQASDKHPDNAEARDALYMKLLEKHCPFTINALFHSMGNYLLKQMLKSSITEGNALTFDNIVLVAADTNNRDHAQWVGQLTFRRRCFITINENDFALAASRAKLGSAQQARLGHWTRNLDAPNAHYVNLTEAAWVRNSHAYFGEPAGRNEKLGEFFRRAFCGEPAEEGLRYHPEGNWYAL